MRSGNACYHSVQNLLSPSLLPKNLKIKIFRTVTLPVVLYGSETWSPTLREERRLRVFEMMVLRRIYGPKRNEVTKELTKLHNKELNDLSSSPNIFRVINSGRMRLAVYVARMRERRGVNSVLVGKMRERDHLEDPGVGGKIILRQIFKKWDGDMDWIVLVQDGDSWRAVVNAVMKIWVP